MAFFTEGKIALLESRLGSRRVSELLGNMEAMSAARRDVPLESLITSPVSDLDEFLEHQFPVEERTLCIHSEYTRPFHGDRLSERKPTLKIYTQPGRISIAMNLSTMQPHQI